MKILVIDDRKENIESAKKLIESVNSKEITTLNHPTAGSDDEDFNTALKESLPIEAIYVKDGKSALNELSNQKFDAILSDVFFDYNEDNTSVEIREKIAEILLDEDQLSSTQLSWNKGHMNKKDAKSWLNGEQTPPTGVLIANEALKENSKLSFSFCTNIYHHDDIGAPVAIWQQSWHQIGREWRMIHYDDSSRSKDLKDWEKALAYVVGPRKYS